MGSALLQSFLELTDAEITAAMREAARDSGRAGHDAAQRILARDHFRVAYQRRPKDKSTLETIFKLATGLEVPPADLFAGID